MYFNDDGKVQFKYKIKITYLTKKFSTNGK